MEVHHLILTALLFSTRLRSRIDAQGIHVRFAPFIIREKTWGWEDLEEVYVRRYSLWDYGGWGYRFSGAGTAYTTKGKYGIQMVLKKGNKRISHQVKKLCCSSKVLFIWFCIRFNFIEQTNTTAFLIQIN